MSWRLISKPRTLRVTKALAKQFAEMEPAPHDRPLSERRLQVYGKLLREGSFRPVTWATARCTETGTTYRVNGKHTSVLLSGLKEMPEFYVVIEEYQCDTLEDVAQLYSTFDSKMMSRTARDIYYSFAGTVPELAGLSHRSIYLACSGMALHNTGNGTPEHGNQPADRAELMLEHPEFVVWLDDLIREGARHLHRAAVVGAMFATWQKIRQAATDFWTAVRDETGTSPDLPDRKLARWLMTTGVDAGRGVHRTRKAPDREFYVRSIHAWNAWRRKENTDLRYYADKDVPTIR